jgi:hypothetical protein
MQQKIKWATITYMGKCTAYITKLFRNTNIKVAYKTNNTTGKILTQYNTNPNTDKFNSCGMYQSTCIDCNMKYVGQTDTLK